MDLTRPRHLRWNILTLRLARRQWKVRLFPVPSLLLGSVRQALSVVTRSGMLPGATVRFLVFLTSGSTVGMPEVTIGKRLSTFLSSVRFRFLVSDGTA